MEKKGKFNSGVFCHLVGRMLGTQKDGGSAGVEAEGGFGMLNQFGCIRMYQSHVTNLEMHFSS